MDNLISKNSFSSQNQKSKNENIKDNVKKSSLKKCCIRFCSFKILRKKKIYYKMSNCFSIFYINFTCFNSSWCYININSYSFIY